MGSASSIDNSKASSAADSADDLEIDKNFRALVKLSGSDLHMKVGAPPYLRVAGSLRPLNRPAIDDDEMSRMIYEMIDQDKRLKDRRRQILDDDGGVDFAHVLVVDGARWRFRVNVLRQLGHLGLVARRINNKIPDFEGLHLPPVMEELCKFDRSSSSCRATNDRNISGERCCHSRCSGTWARRWKWSSRTTGRPGQACP